LPENRPHRENENFLDCSLITNDLSLNSADLPDVVPESNKQRYYCNEIRI
jgi:hypothetical protein